MDGYVDQIDEIRPKDLKKKNLGRLKSHVLNELDAATQELSERGQQYREENTPPADADNGPCSKERLVYYFMVCKETTTGVLVPLLDIVTDVVTSVTHFLWSHYTWGLLTLFFVWLPGFVVALTVAVRGIKKRKECSLARVAIYLVLMLLMPFLYPWIQVLVNGYMVYLMIVNRSREIVSVMGHDVKQFKSLEGFLESGPQFVLQFYILLRGQKEGLENFRSLEATRLLTLVVSILMSFVSLAKTGYNVNRPDPSDSPNSPPRRSKQYPSNAPYFALTSVLFHFVCVLFRVTSLAYFFATLRYYTLLVIAANILANGVILYSVGASWTITFLLSCVSLFMPNGYLLYNFAATFVVDFSFESTRRFLLWHMIFTTGSFLACLVGITSAGQLDADWLDWAVPDNSILNFIQVQNGLNATLMVLALASVALCWLHWRLSIRPLYAKPTTTATFSTPQIVQEGETDVTA